MFQNCLEAFVAGFEQVPELINLGVRYAKFTDNGKVKTAVIFDSIDQFFAIINNHEVEELYINFPCLQPVTDRIMKEYFLLNKGKICTAHELSGNFMFLIQ